MIIECGHTFCKHCIEEWQKKFIVENPYEVPCPECRAVFETVSPNISVKNFINDFTAVILDKEQKKDREETIKERAVDTAYSVAIRLERLSNQNQSISDNLVPGAETNDTIIDEAVSILLPFITTLYGHDIGHMTLETLQQLANTYGFTMPGSVDAILAELNISLSELQSIFDPPTSGADANNDIRDEDTDDHIAEGYTTGEVRFSSTLAALYGLIPPNHGDTTDGETEYGGIVNSEILNGDIVNGEILNGDIVNGDIVNGDIVDDDTVDGDTSEDHTTDDQGTVQITQESLLETADTIQHIFANHRRFPQLLPSSNTREVAATPAPAELEQPGRGVGAIPGEEPTRCVGCQEMVNKNEWNKHIELCIEASKYVADQMCFICDLEFNSLVTLIDHVKKDHFQDTPDLNHASSSHQLEHESIRHLPTPHSTMDLPRSLTQSRPHHGHGSFSDLPHQQATMTQYENIVYIPDGVPFSIDPTTIEFISDEFELEFSGSSEPEL